MVPGHLEKLCPGTALFNGICACFWLDLGESLCSSDTEEWHKTVVYSSSSSHPSSSLGFGSCSPTCCCTGNSPRSAHHFMKLPVGNDYPLSLMQRKDAGLKSSLLSLMSSVQRVLYETVCSKPCWCCTGLHNSGFRSCHWVSCTLCTGRSTGSSL